MRRRRPWILVGAATALFLLAAWVMSRGDQAPVHDKPRVQFRPYLNAEERERMRARQVLPAAPPPADPEAPWRPPPPRDPVLAAMGSPDTKLAVVVEANAIRNMPVGELFVQCLLARQGRNDLKRLKDEVGVDPFQDVDRIAVHDDGLMVSGHFGQTRWDRVFKDLDASSYGDKARLYELRPREFVVPDGGAVIEQIWEGKWHTVAPAQFAAAKPVWPKPRWRR